MKTILCKDCTNFQNTKPLPRCAASKYQDPVTGEDRRTCQVERLDGVGRCGTLANNFSPKKPEAPKPRTNPAKKVDK